MDHRDPDGTPWDLKMDRAAHHTEELRAVTDTYLASRPYEFVTEGGETEIRLRIRVHREPPPTVSTIVGDALHNLRSALDTRVVAVANDLAGRGLTPEEERPLGLPIAKDAERFQDRAGRPWDRAIGADSAARLRGIVMALQPFGAPSSWWRHNFGADDAAAQSMHDNLARRLARLHRLSNVDKHRRVHVALLAMHGAGGWGDVPTEHWWVSHEELHDGDVAARVTIPPGHTFGGLSGDVSVGLPDSPIPLDAAGDLDNLTYHVGQALALIAYEASHAAD